MIKRKSNVQNLIIVILCILLLISIGFGVTYSYYNGNSNLVKGTITTANLSIGLGVDETGQTTEFSISAPLGEEFLVPGNSLNNVELNLLNKCNQDTFMVVVYSLSAVKNDASREDVTPELNNMPAISFQDKIDTSVWQPILYECNNIDATYSCLVGINSFAANTSETGKVINVLPAHSIKIPTEWNDTLQNCNVTISVMAYAIQAKNLEAKYWNPIDEADANKDMEAKAEAIATAVLEICKVDYATGV